MLLTGYVLFSVTSSNGLPWYWNVRLLQSESVNIKDVSVSYNRSVADLRLVVDVRDLEQLSRVLTRIESVPNVLEAQRTKPG